MSFEQGWLYLPNQPTITATPSPDQQPGNLTISLQGPLLTATQQHLTSHRQGCSRSTSFCRMIPLNVIHTTIALLSNMSKAIIVLLDNKPTTVILLDDSSTTVTQSSDMFKTTKFCRTRYQQPLFCRTMHQQSLFSNISVIATLLSKALTTAICSKGKSTVIVCSDYAPAAPSGGSYASSSDTRHHHPFSC